MSNERYSQTGQAQHESPLDDNNGALDAKFFQDLKRLKPAAAFAVAAAGVSFLSSHCSEQAPADTSSYVLHEVEKGQTVGDIVLEACPTASNEEILRAQANIGALMGSSNPANPSVAGGQTIKVPAELYCDTPESQ